MRERKKGKIIIYIFTSIWKLKGRKSIKIMIAIYYFILVNQKLIINFEGIIVISQK